MILRSSAAAKIPWQGVLISVQPRIRLCRSFDERSHTYLGYALRVRGSIGGEAREFLVGVGEGAHAKHRFRAGDTVAGVALPVADPRLETVEFYKVSDLRVSADEIAEEPSHLRGAAFHRLFRSIVSVVIGGLRASVRRQMHELHVGLPHGSRNDYRSVESGAASLPNRDILLWPSFLSSLQIRTGSPGRRGMTYTEEDWIDDEATSHRGPDE